MFLRKHAGRYVFICLLFLVSFNSAEIIGEKSIAAIRVSFVPDVSLGTSGDGTFLLSNDTIFCSKYTIDPTPHNRDYFYSQLKAVNAYFSDVSNQQLTIDLSDSTVFPLGQDSSYTLPQTMDYYHPYGEDDVHDERLTELFRDAIEVAYSVDSIDFSQFDVVVVFHAGVGQDFALPFLDPTPEDIPSTFIDNEMIQTHLASTGINVGGFEVREGLVLPETQNHLLFEDLESSFGTEFNACEYQFGLTGTFSLMLGFILGLPPLWNTESGESGIGVFGLMDQGSNNGRGLIPAPPDAWSRYYAGWENLEFVSPGDHVDVIRRDEGNLKSLAVDGDEYYLFENRINQFRNGVSIDSVRFALWQQTDNYPPYVKVLFDSVAITVDTTGVVIDIPNYDLGLPNSGMLIWHIDETQIYDGISNYMINGDREQRGVDLEEADGAKDIGYPSIFPFSDPSGGYFADMWYKGNPEYVRFNPSLKGEKPVFGPYTIPNTRNNENAATYISIDSISVVGDTMTFQISNSYMVEGFPVPNLGFHFQCDLNSDGSFEYITGNDSLKLTNDLLSDGTAFHSIKDTNFQVITTAYNSNNGAIGIIESDTDSIFISVYKYQNDSLIPLWQYSSTMDHSFIAEGHPDSTHIIIRTFDQDCLFDGLNESCNPHSDVTNFDNANSHITIDGESTETTASLNDDGILSINDETVSVGENFIQIVAIDMDNSQDVEIVGLSQDGDLYVFNSNGTLFSGFPVQIDNAERLLIRDLYGDEHPEIVVQNTDTDFLTFNWKGKNDYFLANPSEGKLIQLGEYNHISAIFTEDAVWTIDSVTNQTSVNSWSMQYRNPSQTRTLALEYDAPHSFEAKILNVEKTYAYPNPAQNGYVKIRCVVGEVDKITCEIFDIAGYFVARFSIDNPVAHDPNEILWNVKDIEPGVYFANVKVQKGSKSEQKILRIGIIQ